MATNVPFPTFGPEGFIAPEESVVLAGVLADIDAAFGGGLNLELETPQGQLASSQTAIIGNTNDNFINLTNQLNPNYAEGRWQDALGAIYFLQRHPSEPTVVDGLCTGLPGTPIPAGSQAIAVDGNIYVSTEDGEIDANGVATITFACSIPGPIDCPAGSLTRIYQAIAGWDTIDNPSDGVVGNDVEGRTEFEARRLASVAGNARGFVAAVRGNVLSVPGVLDAYVTENVLDEPLLIKGVTLNPHSLYVAAVGGTDAAVAEGIWTKKSPGCDYNGNTTVTVEDRSDGLVPPYPSYDVSFERPTSLPILFAVTLVDNELIPDNATVQIQDAIISAFAGSDGGTRVTIGTTVLASRFYPAVAGLGVWAQIIRIDVGSINNPSAVITGSIGGNTLHVNGVISGVVAVGLTVTGSIGGSGVIPAGTRITALGSGAGGTGTYTINKSLTIASQGFILAEPDRDTIDTNIDQIPTVSADNIIVLLI